MPAQTATARAKVQPAEAPPLRGARFSLATMLSAAVIGGLVVYAMVSRRQMDELRAENERLRVLAGVKLEIGDPTVLHLRRLFYAETEGRGCWRVYIPETRPHVLKYCAPGAQRDTPDGLKWKSLPLPAGEYNISVEFDAGLRQGSLLLDVGREHYRIDGYEGRLIQNRPRAMGWEWRTREIGLNGVPEELFSNQGAEQPPQNMQDELTVNIEEVPEQK